MALFGLYRADHPPAGEALSAAEQARSEVRSTAEQLFDPTSPEPMGVYALRPDDPAASLALGVEREVLAEALGARADEAIAGYAPYAGSSLLFCVVDQRRRVPAAMLRIIFPSKAGLKSLNDIERVWGVTYQAMFDAAGVDYDPNHTWDVATMAIAADYRTAAFQGAVTMALCQTISVLGLRLSFTTSVALLHLPVLRMLQWRLLRPFEEIEGLEPRPYLDSAASLPARLVLSEWHRRLATRDRVLHAMMTEGVGLEPVVRPLDWGAAAELATQVSSLADHRLHLR